jgi:5-methyltetrahydropteroyltriglutamate--homocysteine methyltransferase
MRPPFRADHVGSLLRSPELLEARSRHQAGEISPEALRAVEDESIRDVVKLQEDLGFQGVTDGEHRRTMFHTDFLKRFEGVAVRGGLPMKFRSKTKVMEFSPPRLEVVGKLKRPTGVACEDFEFLASVTQNTAKLCIPSPTMLHFRGGRKGVDKNAYPEMEDFFADLARMYREEIAELGALGCTYLQLDDTNLAYLCDPALRQGARERGDDPDELPLRYARLINDSISSRPPEMRVCIHLCRGNFQSAWVAEGGYEPVAEALFTELDVDGFFLEYDDERSGDFAPLRFMRSDKSVVLGLISSKWSELEDKDELKRRIDEAARYVPKDRLALSPQCGFSSTVEGNAITVEDEIAKLRLVQDVATQVWG